MPQYLSQDVRRKVMNRAAKLANKSVRDWLFTDILPNPIQRLHAYLMETSVAKATLLRNTWSPMTPDWRRGLTLRIRESANWLVHPYWRKDINQRSVDAIQQAIMKDAELVVTDLLRNYFKGKEQK